MHEDPKLKAKGARWFHTADYNSPRLSKAGMGNFFYQVLKVGGQIGEIWVFNREYERTPVFVSVFMTETMKQDLETIFEGKIKFVDPPKMVLA